MTEITGDTTFVADYDNLVHRRTGYCVALNGERAKWAQHSVDDIAWSSRVFIYAMDAPQERWEWLSPEPVRYPQWYAKAEPWGEWYFRSNYMSYAPGEYQWRIGCHPLTSGVDIDIWGHELAIWGSISRDSYNNTFYNQQAWFSGHIEVTQDGEVVLDDDIWDYLYRWVSFEGTPQFTVEIWGETPLELSRHSYTRLDFTGDTSNDYRPPELLFRVPGMDLFGVVPSGEVMVKVQVTDDSLIDSVHLDYSLDDGDTWNDAALPVFAGGWYIFNLGQLQETFVALRVDAEDEYGNHIQRTTSRAFRVGSLIPPLLPHAFYGDLLINGASAPVGTTVEARGEGVRMDTSGNPIVTTEVGKYGSAGPLEDKLIVQGDIADGATLTFYVNDVSTGQTAEWHSAELTELDLTVTIVAGVTVSINTPDQVREDSDFTATVDIGEVVDLNAAQYDVSFDNTVLRLDDITSGQIDGTEIPLMSTEISPGTWRVVQIMGLDTVSGSGSLAVLHFHVIGSTGESSAIDLSNGMLSGFEGEIPATWTGDLVEVVPPVEPGDANGDGVINVLDITKVVRIILALDAETLGSDANEDGEVNVLDITKIVRIILGLD
ncbi:hypothetical protein ES708_23168 [subsurface metagenome]